MFNGMCGLDVLKLTFYVSNISEIAYTSIYFLFFLEDVFPPDDLGSGPYIQFIYWGIEISSFQEAYTYQEFV